MNFGQSGGISDLGLHTQNWEKRAVMSPAMRTRPPDSRTKLDHVDVSFIRTACMDVIRNTLRSQCGINVEEYSVTLAIFYLAHRLLVINGISENTIPQRVVKMYTEENSKRGALFETTMGTINEDARNFLRRAIALIASASCMEIKPASVACPVDGLRCIVSNDYIAKGQECKELNMVCEGKIYTYYFMPCHQERLQSIICVYRMDEVLSGKFKDEKYKDFLAVHDMLVTDEGIKLAYLYITSTENVKSWLMTYSQK